MTMWVYTDSKSVQLAELLGLETVSPNRLGPSMPDGPNCCCLKGSTPYWSKPSFLILDIRALWHSELSARVPKCQKLETVG